MSGSAVRIEDVATLDAECRELAALGAPFDRLYVENGTPPLWRREASYATIVRLILEQQVSLASATAAFRRLEDRVGAVTPAAIVESSDAELKGDGFSRQKARYVRVLAASIERGVFDPAALDESSAQSTLESQLGIGPWTSACYRLFVLGEPDVWPTGDRALYVSLARNLGLEDVPARDVSDDIAASWSPHRSTAARMLWHDYLGGSAYVVSADAGFL